MKVLILNSGMGSRMGVLTKEHPKCMTDISMEDTILSRQLKLISEEGLNEVIMTTGLFDRVLIDYCNSLNLPINYTFVKNNNYQNTNYIYSIYEARDYLDDDILLMHGDLVFEKSVLKDVLKQNKSVMTTSSTVLLPEKDFKAVIKDNHIIKVGIEFFIDAMAAQPLYLIKKDDFKIWLDKIIEYCESGNVKCYAENAFNEVSDKCLIYPLDVKDRLCNEIDNPIDLEMIKERLSKIINQE